MANKQKKTAYRVGQKVVFRIRGSPDRAVDNEGRVDFFIAVFEIKVENTIINEQVFLPMACLDYQTESIWDSNIRLDMTFKIKRIFHKNELTKSVHSINKAKALSSNDWICFLETDSGFIIRCPLYLLK